MGVNEVMFANQAIKDAKECIDYKNANSYARAHEIHNNLWIAHSMLCDYRYRGSDGKDKHYKSLIKNKMDEVMKLHDNFPNRMSHVELQAEFLGEEKIDKHIKSNDAAQKKRKMSSAKNKKSAKQNKVAVKNKNASAKKCKSK